MSVTGTLDSMKVVVLTPMVFTVTTDDNATNVLYANEYGGFDALMFATLEDAFAGTITLNVLASPALDQTSDNSYCPLHSPPGTAITLAAASAIVVTSLPATGIRFESSGTEADDATIYVTGLRYPK
jgi:hypothetical protein